MEIHKNNTNENQELSFEDIANLIWKKRILFISVNIISCLIGILFAINQTITPKQFMAVGMIDIGKFVNVSGDNKLFEGPGDLSPILKKLFGVQAQIISGSNKLVEVTFVGPIEKEAVSRVDNAIKYAIDRHEYYLKGNDSKNVKFIEKTKQVGPVDVIIIVDDGKKIKKIIGLFAVAGLFISLMIIISQKYFLKL